MGIKINEYTFVGDSTTMECKYDLEGEELYVVKWYKDGDEFYKFLPRESPKSQVFDVIGVNVDVTESTAESVHLRHLEVASSGKYRCEVTVEAPSFNTVTNYSFMHTVPMSNEEPHKSKASTPGYSFSTAQPILISNIFLYNLYVIYMQYKTFFLD